MIDKELPIRLPPEVVAVPHASMSDYTTFRLGGPCPVLLDCPNAQVLAEVASGLAQSGQDFLVIGQGSNLLVSDRGIDAFVLRFCSEDAPDVVFDAGLTRVSGHTLLDDLARITI